MVLYDVPRDDAPRFPNLVRRYPMSEIQERCLTRVRKRFLQQPSPERERIAKQRPAYVGYRFSFV